MPASHLRRVVRIRNQEIAKPNRAGRLDGRQSAQRVLLRETRATTEREAALSIRDRMELSPSDAILAPARDYDYNATQLHRVSGIDGPGSG